MIYTQDNRAFAGRTADDVVCRMLESNVFTEAKLPAVYMQGVADRALRLEGATVRHDTAENFLADLTACGVINFGSGQ